MKPKYSDFILTVDGSPARYTVEARAPGETQISPQPFLYHETAELMQLLEEIQQGVSASFETMQSIGTILYNALFPRPIYGLWKQLQNLPNDTKLCLSLNIRPPELSHLPWELLYDPEDKIFLATRRSYPIVRYIESAKAVASPLTSHPIRLLYLQSNPYDTEPLDLAGSLQALQAAWRQDCEITVVKNTSPSALRDVLREEPGFNILHYDGHAEFDESAEEGYLVLHDANGGSERLAGSTLADYLDNSSIRLVVLAACETAVNSTQQRFAGIAHQLMRNSSLPAVVAMQFAISDSMAIAFNREFYKALADDYPIEAAIIQGRQAILEQIGGGRKAFANLDWATPVLFMRRQNHAIDVQKNIWNLLPQTLRVLIQKDYSVLESSTRFKRSKTLVYLMLLIILSVAIFDAPSGIATPSNTPTPIPSVPTNEPSVVPSTVPPTQTATETPIVTETATQTATQTPTITPNPNQAPIVTDATVPSSTVPPTQTATEMPTHWPIGRTPITVTPITVTPTLTPTKTPTVTQTATDAPIVTVTPTQTATQTPTITQNPNQAPIVTDATVPSSTVPPTQTATETPTVTLTPTETPTTEIPPITDTLSNYQQVDSPTTIPPTVEPTTIPPTTIPPTTIPPTVEPTTIPPATIPPTVEPTTVEATTPSEPSE